MTQPTSQIISPSTGPNLSQQSSSIQGRAFEDHVVRVLIAQGWTIIERNWRHHEANVEIDIVAEHPDYGQVWFECKGSWKESHGLERNDSTKKAICDAWLLSLTSDRRPYWLVTSHFPKEGLSGDLWLRTAVAEGIFAKVKLVPWADELEEWEWR